MRKKLLLLAFLLPLIVFGQTTADPSGLTYVRRPLPVYGSAPDTIRLVYDSMPRVVVQLSQFEISAVFVEKITISNRPVVLYKPSDFDPAKKYPVWVFLHGLSEMSRDKAEPDRIINNGNHAALLAAAEKHKFIVVAPQLVQNLHDWIPGWTNKYLQPVYDYIITNPSTDLTHIVVTGLSLGGGGTWVAITGSFAPYVSAAIPICGTPQYDQDYTVVAKNNSPVWAFHAKDDKTVGYEATINTVNEINKSQPLPVPKMSIWNTGGHGIWGTVYGTTEVYTWALSQSNNTVPIVIGPAPPPIVKKILSITYFSDGSKITVYDDKTVAYN
jgi:predicted peptidase